MSGESVDDVITAVIAALKADGGVVEAVAARVHDEAPEKTAYPYVHVVRATSRADKGSNHDGRDILLEIDVWADRRQTLDGAAAMEAVIAALDDQPLTVAGHNAYLVLHDSTQVRRSGDGKRTYRTIYFRILTD